MQCISSLNLCNACNGGTCSEHHGCCCWHSLWETQKLVRSQCRHSVTPSPHCVFPMHRSPCICFFFSSWLRWVTNRIPHSFKKTHTSTGKYNLYSLQLIYKRDQMDLAGTLCQAVLWGLKTSPKVGGLSQERPCERERSWGGCGFPIRHPGGVLKVRGLNTKNKWYCVGSDGLLIRHSQELSLQWHRLVQVHPCPEWLQTPGVLRRHITQSTLLLLMWREKLKAR